MKIAIPKETHKQEKRCAILPDIVKKLKKLGVEIAIEKGVGNSLFISDEEYKSAGAEIFDDKKALISSSDIIFRLHPPSLEEINLMKENSIYIGFLNPFSAKDILIKMKEKKITSICFELLPRTTIAQKMDALSSQANLAGYVAVLLAADSLQKIFPMLTTPSGTLFPIKIFIIGVGVAGLQAIATAKRLGAKVYAFDTRPSVEEQVKSLGARFVKIELGETQETKEGYATQLTQEQLEKQKKAMEQICVSSDIVITTAQVLGKKAPQIISKKIIEQMSKGSVIVDMAIETGGNVEKSKLNEEVIINGVKILGYSNLAARVAYDASCMYAANLFNLFEHFWNTKNKLFSLDLEKDILSSSTVTHKGEFINEKIKHIMEKGER